MLNRLTVQSTFFTRHPPSCLGAGVARRPYATSPSEDTFNIIPRFVEPQKAHFHQALKEIRSGRKVSCWSWYVLPTAPWIVNGVERGSPINAHHALRGDEQVGAFLQTQYDGVDLRRNYIAIVEAMADQVERGVPFSRLLGALDDPKARSSLRLFERYGRDHCDVGLQRACRRLMDLINEPCEN
eukprot:PhM_4_TR3709/c0_g2_i1/m.62829